MQQPPNPYPHYPQHQWQQLRMPEQQQGNPQQPQQPPQYQPPRLSPKKKSRKRLWFILAVVVVVLAIIIGVASQGQSQKPTPATQQTQATQMPAKATTRTSTPTQQLSIADNIAVLGGTISAFDNKIGASNCCYENGWDTNTMWVGVYTAEDGSRWYQAVGEQSNERVVGIRIHPYNTDINQTGTPVWDMPTTKKICNAYMPSDAMFQKTYQHIFANLADGVINEYYSPWLAHTLPGGDFTDSNNHPEKPGLFFVYFNYARPDNASQNDFCALGTDFSLQREDVV